MAAAYFVEATSHVVVSLSLSWLQHRRVVQGDTMEEELAMRYGKLKLSEEESVAMVK